MRKVIIQIAVLLLIVVGLGFLLRLFGIDVTAISPDQVRSFVLSFGVWAPLVYICAYGQPIVPLPASIMTISGGLAFGPLWGTCAAVTGATTRAATQFGIARLLGREAVAKLMKGKVAKLDQKIGENGFKAVLLIRMIPNVPYDMQNFGLGFSQIKFFPYILATFLGIIPGGSAYVYFGYSLTDPKQIWKLGLAILIIIGLMVAQHKWKHSREQN